MKWLKKDSSDNEQISTAESHPGPEHLSQQAPAEIYPSESEVIEQPSAGMPSLSQRQYGRRRFERIGEEEVSPRKQSRNPFDSLRNSWVAHHWKIFAILMVIFCLAFFARAYYGLEPATDDGFVLSGGSDSYYHHHVITHGTDTGNFHFWDNNLNYPVGTRNPRPPLYDWSVTLGGKGLSPFFSGDVYASTFYVFLFSTAFWGALTIFPTYFLGKEAFGKKTGIIAAFILAVIPGHVQRSVLSNADHDAMTLFFMVTSFYFFLKALKTITPQEWISDWTKPKGILEGLKSFIISNKLPVLYAVLAGFSITAVALVWQGFAYAIVLISVYFLFQILLNRFRNIDSLGVFVIYFTAIGTGLLFAFPYYYQSIQIASWFDTPTYLFFGLSVFSLILMATRKYPWLLVFTSLIGITLLTVFILQIVAPSILDSMINALLSGGGYFINNKQYQTIAEAQAPPFSNLALSFGVFTFWLSFIGVAWAAIQLPKSWKPDFTFILLWAGTSIYMAVSAARFMFNAGPAFAITAGWITAIIIGKLDFRKYLDTLRRASKPHMTQNFKIMMLVSVLVLVLFFLAMTSVSNIAYPVFVIGLTAVCGIYMLNLIAETNPNRMYNLFTVMIPALGALFYIVSEFNTHWEMNAATHVFILSILLFSYLVLYLQVRKVSLFFMGGVVFLAFCIVVPNVWAGLDAGIPYETKLAYDKDIYNSMPVFMQSSTYDAVNGSNWYLGGFGYSLPLNSRYWPAAYDWLATQDAEIYPASDRPAFLSWWDYGFEVVNEGQHPAVADNFLGGHQLAGNFIMAQSEEDAIALLSVRILEGNYLKHWIGEPNSFDPEVITLLNQYGIDTEKLNHIFANPSNYVDEILANPDIYGPRDDIIQNANAKYIASRVLISSTLDENGVVDFYRDLCELTGNSILYFGIDSRLFPFSAQNTGIFYAPAKLSDHRISDIANQPYDFWEIKAVGEFGGEYDLDDIPLDVNLDPNTPYKLVYNEMFYNTMLYKAFIGYSGTDIGSGNAGIPGLSGDLSSNPIMPGWNMTHFKLVHRTAYWNPYSAEEIQNHTDAWRAMNYWDAKEKQENGEGISDLSDRSSLYQGVMMLKYYHGAVISGKVMLEDGTPVGGVSVTVYDDFNIPHQRVLTDGSGYYSIIAPPGDITLVASTGNVDPMYLVGSEVNTTSMTIEDYKAMRVKEDRDGDGKYDYLIEQNLVIGSASLSGTVFWDSDSSGDLGDSEPTIGNAQLFLTNNEVDYEITEDTDESGSYTISSLPPGSYNIQVKYANRTIGTNDITLAGGEAKEQDLAMPVISLSGTAMLYDGTPARAAVIRLWDSEEDIEYKTLTDSNGTYSFDNVLYGGLYSQATYYEYASSIQAVDIAQNINNTLDFSLYTSVKVDGVITLKGVPIPYSSVKFTGPSSSVVTADSSGRYSVILNAGEYTYYVSHAQSDTVYSGLNHISLHEDYPVLNIELKPGCFVSGKVVNANGINVAYTQVAFFNQDTEIFVSATTDENGDYSITVPKGPYIIQVSSGIYGSFYTSRVLESGTYVQNIETRPGTIVLGTVFWDVNEDGIPGTDEQLTNARITFKEPSGKIVQAVTNETGKFGITLPSTTSYQVSVSRKGFHSAYLGTMASSDLSRGITQSLEPILIPISGALNLEGEALTDQNIILDFRSEISGLPSAEFQVDRDGSYSGLLSPGMYTVSFTHNVSVGNDSMVYQIEEEITFDTGLYAGEAIDLDIESVQRSKVWIHLTDSNYIGANITFKDGPEERRFDMESNEEFHYVKPGNYVISAVHPLNDSVLVDMFDASIFNGSNNFYVGLKNGIKVTGTLQHDNDNIPYQLITFNDAQSNGTVSVYSDENGNFDVILLPDLEYRVDVDFVDYQESPYLRAYRYYSKDKVIETRTTISNYLIDLEKENYTTRLSGFTSLDDSPIPNTELRFISEFDVYTTVSDLNGGFTLDIPPAEYTVYAHNPTRHYASLFDSTIEIEQETLDVNLASGNKLYGTIYYERNLNAMTDVTFTSQDGINISAETDSSGYYEIWLPSDTYRVISQLQTSRNELDVTYSFDSTIYLSNDRQFNLPLSMNEERIVFVSFDPTQFKEVRANSTIQYSFEVENMGNIRDTYDVMASGGNPDWVTDISIPEVTIDPGANNKVRMAVTAKIPPGARVDQSKITITAISQKNTSVRHSNVMNLLIKQNGDFAIQPSASPSVFSQGIIDSEFSILNKGNGPDKVTIYIANNEDLNLNGWSVTLGAPDGSQSLNDGKRVSNISIAYDGTANIPLFLTPTSANPSRQAKILIVGYSQNDESMRKTNYIVVQYPELKTSSLNLTVSGPGVLEDGSGNQLINVGVMIASVSAALILFYYARKKRWIR